MNVSRSGHQPVGAGRELVELVHRCYGAEVRAVARAPVPGALIAYFTSFSYYPPSYFVLG
jgi:hypothetical protein